MTSMKIDSEQKPLLTYENNTVYEITITPDDKHQFFHKRDRLVLFAMTMQGFFRQCFDRYDIKYELYLELSEPVSLSRVARNKSVASRLHFHGTIKFPSLLSVGNFLLHSQYSLTRHSDIQINPFRTEWIPYITKQNKIMMELCKHNRKIPYRYTHDMAEIVR